MQLLHGLVQEATATNTRSNVTCDFLRGTIKIQICTMHSACARPAGATHPTRPVLGATNNHNESTKVQYPQRIDDPGGRIM